MSVGNVYPPSAERDPWFHQLMTVLKTRGYGPVDVSGEDGKMLWLAVGSAPYDENPYGPRWAWGQ